MKWCFSKTDKELKKTSVIANCAIKNLFAIENKTDSNISKNQV